MSSSRSAFTVTGTSTCPSPKVAGSLLGRAEVKVDDVGRETPPALAALERAHEREIEAVEDLIGAHVD